MPYTFNLLHMTRDLILLLFVCRSGDSEVTGLDGSRGVLAKFWPADPLWFFLHQSIYTTNPPFSHSSSSPTTLISLAPLKYTHTYRQGIFPTHLPIPPFTSSHIGTRPTHQPPLNPAVSLQERPT
ncbi:hypothetical protein K440DRAFT_98524 [Wilcoxina mikolae CBS 423.85]|nr:hypothetical protein K440DRAFT_98524 [Wilcoxina mikolae CBS 423.85]